MTAFRAQRLAQADLERPLGDAHQHDIHHDDAANDQRDHGDRRNHRRYRAGKLIYGVVDRLDIHHAEVVELIAHQLVLVAQLDARFFDGFLELFAVRRFAMHLQALTATEHALPGGQRDVDVIVHRVAKHRPALFFDADDGHRQVFDL